jgi:hypothetical protein
MARPEIAQLVQSGAQMGLGLMQEKRMRDVFGLEQDKFAIEQEAAGAINSVAQGEAEFSKKRGAGAQVLGEIRKLSAMDPAVRKSQAPVVFQALESATGKPLADNLKQFILSAKPEIAGPVVDKLLRGYSQDPSQTLDNLNDLLSNPLASANAIGQISRDLGDVAAQESLTGPTANPRRNKFNEQKASIERRIAGYEQAIQRYPQSKSAETAQREVDRLRGNLEKMENILSVQEASAMGVRPGTTLTESGTGNVAVLQGPDDSGSGASGAGGLKATDERFLRTLAAAPYETEIDLQTGTIKFKNRADEVAANATTAMASRIFADAKGRLTLSEAHQEAIKKAGAGAAGGTADLNDPYAGF